MRLLTVVVSHNRPELLAETLRSYRETVEVPHDLIVVDNASDDATRQVILESGAAALLLTANRYPGYATNRGWRLHEGHDLLHRSDNDVRYLPGWSTELVGRFRTDARLGQVGLMTDEQEGAGMPAVGGNMAIRRELFDAGVRYTDEPWDVVPWEDGTMTASVTAMNWKWARVQKQCLVHMGDPPDFSDPYYRRTYAIRGLEVPGQ